MKMKAVPSHQPHSWALTIEDMDTIAESLRLRADRRGRITVAEGAAGREELRLAAKLIRALSKQHQKTVIVPW
jgi:hypothetical protein